MTVPNENFRSGPYTGNGATTSFAYDFIVHDESALAVFVTTAAGVASQAVLDTDYTVTGVGNTSGGSVTFTTAPASGETIVISLAQPMTQESDYQTEGAFDMQTVETDFDRACLRAKTTVEKLSRAMVFPQSDGVSAPELPNTAARLDSYLGFDAAGNPTALPGPQASANPAFGSFADAQAATIGSSVVRISTRVALLNPDGVSAVHSVDFARATGSEDATTACFQSADGAFWIPCEPVTPLHFGFGKNGLASDDTPYLLSDTFATLGAAQAAYPKATALTETVDDMAFQKATDYLRDSIVLGATDQEVSRRLNTNSSMDISLHLPRGVYYLTRSWDLTGIELNHSFWRISADGAVIMGCVPDGVMVDLTGSRKCVFDGVGTVLGLWTSDGVSRVGIQIGRDSGSSPADNHSFYGGWEIRGRFKLAALYNYASEYVRYGNLMTKNALDDRVFHCDFDGSDGTLTFTAGEAVTWDGGSSTGTVRINTSDKASGSVAIEVITGSLADDDVVTGGTSGKVVTINGTPNGEPSGEGPDGRSYALIADGDNYWGLTSAYLTNPTQNVAQSFLRNIGVLDARHTGRGDAVWMTRAVMHDYTNSYVVSEDHDGAAGWVLFFNTSSEGLDGLTLDCHVETDQGDTDNTTGIDYGVKIESASAGRDVKLNGFSYRRNKAQISLAQFFAGTNIDTVAIRGEIETLEVGRDAGQVMFSDPAKFSVHGRILCHEDGTGPFLNVSSLAAVSGEVVCEDITSSNVRHASGQYRLRDISGAVVYLGDFDMTGELALNVDASTGNGDWVIRNVANGNTLARVRYKASSDQFQFLLGGSGNDYTMSSTSISPSADNTSDLGTASLRYGEVRAVNHYGTVYRDENGDAVVRAQQGAVADATDAASAITQLNALLARLRTHGLIAT